MKRLAASGYPGNMPNTLRFIWSFMIVSLFVAPVQGDEAIRIDFEKQIRPILLKRCAGCHGPKTQKSDLRLDAKSFALNGGVSGEVILPRRSSESELIRRVESTDEAERMPPDAPALPKPEIELLKRWIDAGANWPETDYDRNAVKDPRRNHWAFQPLRDVQPPAAKGAAQNPIDHFIAARLAQNGLRFSSAADRRTLIRRLSLDLLGLPPSPEEVIDFLNDESPQATVKLVDRLLASPHYGERWAQHWLDGVRYADTHGFEVNTPRENAWPYRDYVIRAFNEDKPYNQFVIEQIAGDAVDADEATGFLVSAAALLPAQIGKDDASKRLARQDELDEIVIGTSGTFLGLTVGCARCHDHKFDPIAQREYYALQAFFAGVEYGDRPWKNERQAKRLAEANTVKSRIEELKFRLDSAGSGQPKGPRASADELKALEAKHKELVKPQLVYAGKFRRPDETFLLRRGDPEQKLDPVAPAVPGVLGDLQLPAESQEQDRRMELALWIVSPDNPLSARVMVNRIWQYHFGQGLVATPSDFGVNGSKPSHPELLDWLAAKFIKNGWSLKHMHRLIVLSRTYQQQSTIPLEARGRDDRWLWRFPARRLEAEAIRDSLLFATGELNPLMGGPGFNFFKSRGGLSGFPPVENFGPAEMRRMIYAHKIRMETAPVFGAFDCPDAGQPAPKRSQSTTAIQALNLFNSPFVLERASRFAQRLKSQHPDQPEAQIQSAFRLALGRDPSREETSATKSLIGQHGLETLGRVLFNTNEFLFLP